MKTALEMLDRLEALARRIAAESLDCGKLDDFDNQSVVENAKAIVDDMYPQVDDDLVEANRLALNHGWDTHDTELPGEPFWEGSGCAVALAGIRRGRELAHADYVPCGSVRYSGGSYPTYKRLSESRLVEPTA